MIVKFAKPGKSFKGVGIYLLHDAGHAETAERVAWTHTLNLAHDEAEAAIAEMRTTAFNAEVLKAEHGVGGRKVEKPVRHFSLNWHPEESPDRAEMIGAVRSFLKHMGWERHQAVLIAHDDTAHRHVHVVLNAIDPETGLKLDDGFERRRAQAWALEYEKEHGKIYCEERLKPAAEREESIPRNAWMEIEEQGRRAAEAERDAAPFDPSYMSREMNRRVVERHEWQLIKAVHREEREAFFESGREVYRELHRAVYREVREEFRPEWASYYAARREGLSPEALAEIRADLIARQKEVMEERFTAVAADRRAERDLEYRGLLDAQKDERRELIERQELGLRSPELLDRAYPARVEAEPDAELEQALDRFGITRGRGLGMEDGLSARMGRGEQVSGPTEDPLLSSPLGGSEKPPSRDFGLGVAGGVLGALGHLADSLLGGHARPAPKARPAPDAQERSPVQGGRPPAGDATERAAREEGRAHEDRREWREWHHYAERER